MKAIRLQEIGQLELAEVSDLTPRDGELLIKTGAATICTSDLNDIRGNPFHIPLPVVIGHEGAGTVAAVGPAVYDFAVGDRVATHPVHPCGSCIACRGGNAHLCLNMRHFGINMPGTMADFYIVRQDRARHIPDAVSFSLAALAEPVCVCLEALAQARLTPGQSLLIIGDGPFGVLMARLAAKLGLGRVVISGLEDFRLRHARSAASVQTINVRDLPEPVAALRSLAGAEGYDAAILAVGSQAAFQQAFACLKPKGRLVLFAAVSESTPVDLFSVHLKEYEIIGACNDQDRLDEAIGKLSDPSLSLADLVTHRFPLSEYRRAFELASAGKDQALKIAFVFDAYGCGAYAP